MGTKSTLQRGLAIGLVVLVTAAVGGAVYAQGQTSLSLNGTLAVEFSNCVESIGVTLVPTASVREYVPNQFIPVGEGQPSTPLVVRTARCGGIAVAGQRPSAGEIVQVGAVIVPPDGTGDINNYTIWYYTSDAQLALRLLLAGVNAQYVPTLDYDYQTRHNSFHVRVPLPGVPRLELSGTVNPSPQAAGSFVANWWHTTREDNVKKMSTSVPIIKIGGADLSLTTHRHSPLGRLIGDDSTGFPVLQQFNTFSGAHMEVRAANVTITFPAAVTWGPQGTPLPPGSELVSPADLAAMARQEDFQFITRAGLDDAAAQAQTRLATAKRLVDEVAASNPSLAHLVPVAPRESETLERIADGNYRLTLGADRFILHGTDWLYEATASSLTRTTSRPNREADFRSLIDLLPGDQRRGLPVAANLARLTDAELAAANNELVRRVELFVPNEPLTSSSANGGASTVASISKRANQQAADAAGVFFPGTGCSNHQYDNIYAKVDWPMKAYTTPVRTQGQRGSCTAFGIQGAIEARIFQTRGIKSDYSEQELYAVAKGLWFPTSNAYGDGLHADEVLDELMSRGGRLDAEVRWPYNTSPNRIDNEENETYTHSCDGYTNYCSNTNHQMKIVCTSGSQAVCGTKLPPGVTGAGTDPVKLTGWVSLWNGFEPENSLASIRAHLNAGHPVVLAIDADDLFRDAAARQPSSSGGGFGPGIVDWPQGGETIGGHDLVVVGYLPNGQLPPFVAAPDGYGGGYLIAKNSWGCKGDGGYMYLNYDWVIDQTHGAYAVTNVSTTAIAPETTLSVDKSVLSAPGHVNFTANVNRTTTKIEIFRGLGTDHKILTKTLPGNAPAVATAIDGFIDSGQNGVYIYWARATDQFGNVAASNKVGVNVQIDDTNPLVQLTAESTNVGAPGTVALHASASDNVGVTRVKFYRGFQLLGEDTTAPYSLSQVVLLGDIGSWPYVAIAFDAAGNQKMSNVVTVSVTSALKPFVFSFTATPSSLPVGGGATTLSWNVAGANSVAISPGVGPVTEHGSFPLAVSQSTTYVLTATNNAGTTTASTSVSVTVVPPPIIQSFTATPATLPGGGGTATLAWNILGSGTSVSIDHGVGDVTGVTQKSVSVGATTTYRLTATNVGGTSTRDVTVTVSSATDRRSH